MRSSHADPERLACPRCGEDRPDMIDRTELGCYCVTCSQSWVPKPPEPKA